MKQSIGSELLQERELLTMGPDVKGILNTQPLTCVNEKSCRPVRRADFIQPDMHTVLVESEESDRKLDEDYAPKGTWSRNEVLERSEWDGNLNAKMV